MHVVGVLDLLGGVVVRGVAGRRQEYRPIESTLCATSRPADVACALVDHLGLRTLYVADLDAIAGQEPSWDAYAAVRASGAHLWLDAGVRTADQARRLRPEGTVVVGLETVDSPATLATIAAELRADMIFSLDLRNGEPLAATGWRSSDGWGIAREAIALGVTRLLVLDLARVGVGHGTGTEDFCDRLSRQHPSLDLIAGGGVRGTADLARLGQCGVTSVLVASALHDGRLTRDDLS